MAPRNIITSIQQIHTHPEKAFKEINKNRLLFKCFWSECYASKIPLVRIRDLVPNVIYNVMCRHYDNEIYITLILNNIMIQVNQIDVSSGFVMYDGKKVVSLTPKYDEGTYRHCFCGGHCSLCGCFKEIVDESIYDFDSNCECLTECRIITFDLDLTLKRLEELLPISFLSVNDGNGDSYLEVDDDDDDEGYDSYFDWVI